MRAGKPCSETLRGILCMGTAISIGITRGKAAALKHSRDAKGVSKKVFSTA